MSHDVFISYSTANQTTAQAICHVLEQNNLKCWIAPRDIPGGSNYANEIVNAIQTAKLVVLVFSKDSQESKYVNNEINIAFSNNKPIISFKIDESMPKNDMEYYLKNKHWLEAYPEPEKEFETLIRDSLKWCNEEVEKINFNFIDFAPNELSNLKKDYLSLILLFTPIYWASFLYMGFTSDKNLWKIMGLIYLIPSVMSLALYLGIFDEFFFIYPQYISFVNLFIIFWILAIIHGILIRNEFLTRKSVLRMMSSDDELFDDLLNEYSKI